MRLRGTTPGGPGAWPQGLWNREYIHLSQFRALQPLTASCYCPSFFSPAYQVHVAKTSELMSKPCFPTTELRALYSPLCETHDWFSFHTRSCSSSLLYIFLPQVPCAPPSNMLFLLSYEIRNKLPTLQGTVESEHKRLMVNLGWFSGESERSQL